MSRTGSQGSDHCGPDYRPLASSPVETGETINTVSTAATVEAVDTIIIV